MQVVQIGAGLVGQVIVEDLLGDFEVTVVDPNPKALEKIKEKFPQVTTQVASGTDTAALRAILEKADVATAGVPGQFGYEMMKAVIETGTSLADISFMAEDFDLLHDLALKNNVTVVPDIGVAPGMSNFLMGRGAALLDEVDEAFIYVGGIPDKPVPPFNYQVTWSPKDCIEEFTRPARYIREGKLVVDEATSGLHLKEFPVGTLEVFYTDGLRSLLKNIPGRNVGEMTMRWPGHVEQMRLLRSMGLFDATPRKLGGAEVSPLEVAADLLFPMWEMRPEEGDRDLTVMLVEVEGFQGKDRVRYSWYLEDRFDEASWNTSMSRCTGCTCAIFARAIAKGLITQKGVLAPEKLAASDELFEFVLKEQKKRNLKYLETFERTKDIRE